MLSSFLYKSIFYKKWAGFLLYNFALMYRNPDSNRAVLALEDGNFYTGYSKGYNDNLIFSVGEVVFNTAMTGYQEIITDPSYHSQIINFTHPHIGNVGINTIDHEASAIFAQGIIAKKISDHYSNWRADCSLPEFLCDNKVVAIDGVDTRAITHHLRLNGALAACIMPVAQGDSIENTCQRALAEARAFTGLNNALLAKEASALLPNQWNGDIWNHQNNCYDEVTHQAQDAFHVVVIDCGCKQNILRSLINRKCTVSVVDYDIEFSELINKKPDAVMVSNGPGDPAPCTSIQTVVAQLIQHNIPVFGLCLGHQIVAMALGGKTEKMKFGHHGANHPVMDDNGLVIITSQNHGFSVRADSLPDYVKITYTSLFDGSLQGFISQSPPIMTFQGHPEASPGPSDAGVLFDRFIELIRNHYAQAPRY